MTHATTISRWDRIAAHRAKLRVTYRCHSVLITYQAVGTAKVGLHSDWSGLSVTWVRGKRTEAALGSSVESGGDPLKKPNPQKFDHINVISCLSHTPLTRPVR